MIGIGCGYRQADVGDPAQPVTESKQPRSKLELIS
jgi:hypothetical protein